MLGDPLGSMKKFHEFEYKRQTKIQGGLKEIKYVRNDWKPQQVMQNATGEAEKGTESTLQFWKQDRFEQCWEVFCGLVNDNYVHVYEYIRYPICDCIGEYVIPSHRCYGVGNQ